MIKGVKQSGSQQIVLYSNEFPPNSLVSLHLLYHSLIVLLCNSSTVLFRILILHYHNSSFGRWGEKFGLECALSSNAPRASRAVRATCQLPFDALLDSAIYRMWSLVLWSNSGGCRESFNNWLRCTWYDPCAKSHLKRLPVQLACIDDMNGKWGPTMLVEPTVIAE